MDLNISQRNDIKRCLHDNAETIAYVIKTGTDDEVDDMLNEFIDKLQRYI